MMRRSWSRHSPNPQRLDAPPSGRPRRLRFESLEVRELLAFAAADLSMPLEPDVSGEWIIVPLDGVYLPQDDVTCDSEPAASPLPAQRLASIDISCDAWAWGAANTELGDAVLDGPPEQAPSFPEDDGQFALQTGTDDWADAANLTGQLDPSKAASATSDPPASVAVSPPPSASAAPTRLPARALDIGRTDAGAVGSLGSQSTHWDSSRDLMTPPTVQRKQQAGDRELLSPHQADDYFRAVNRQPTTTATHSSLTSRDDFVSFVLGTHTGYELTNELRTERQPAAVPPTRSLATTGLLAPVHATVARVGVAMLRSAAAMIPTTASIVALGTSPSENVPPTPPAAVHGVQRPQSVKANDESSAGSPIAPRSADRVESVDGGRTPRVRLAASQLLPALGSLGLTLGFLTRSLSDRAAARDSAKKRGLPDRQGHSVGAD